MMAALSSSSFEQFKPADIEILFEQARSAQTEKKINLLRTAANRLLSKFGTVLSVDQKKELTEFYETLQSLMNRQSDSKNTNDTCTANE